MWPSGWGQSTATVGGNESQSTATVGTNVPLPPAPPQADLSQQVARHLGLHCLCPLLDCCHHEMPEDNYAFKGGFHAGHHVDSGSPASGYLYPWEPGDESWRQAPPDFWRGHRERMPLGPGGEWEDGRVHTKPLLPLEWIAVAAMVERLGGKVTITDADLASFDRRAELVQYAAPEGGIVLELRRTPYTVAGEVVREPAALPAGST